jgi:hypothetical protein
MTSSERYHAGQYSSREEIRQPQAGVNWARSPVPNEGRSNPRTRCRGPAAQQPDCSRRRTAASQQVREVEFASVKGQDLGARRWLGRGPQGNSKWRTQAYVIFPRVIGACRSRDTGNHREGQECRNDDLHDGLLVHLADDIRPNARDDELLFVLKVCRRSHEKKMLQSRALALSWNASGSIARVAQLARWLAIELEARWKSCRRYSCVPRTTERSRVL